MNKTSDVVEDFKQNITDNQYKTIMDSLMEIKNNNNGNLMVIYYHYYPKFKNAIHLFVCSTGQIQNEK
jgi:hypothetical protein